MRHENHTMLFFIFEPLPVDVWLVVEVAGLIPFIGNKLRTELDSSHSGNVNERRLPVLRISGDLLSGLHGPG